MTWEHPKEAGELLHDWRLCGVVRDHTTLVYCRWCDATRWISQANLDRDRILLRERGVLSL